MKTKEKYSRPEIEVIEMMVEGVIATSPGDELNFTEDEAPGGPSRSKRGFWDD